MLQTVISLRHAYVPPQRRNLFEMISKIRTNMQINYKLSFNTSLAHKIYQRMDNGYLVHELTHVYATEYTIIHKLFTSTESCLQTTHTLSQTFAMILV